MPFDWLAAGIALGGQAAALAAGEAADRAGKGAVRRMRRAADQTREAVDRVRGCVGGHASVEVLEDSDGSGDVLKYRCKRCGKVGWAG